MTATSLRDKQSFRNAIDIMTTPYFGLSKVPSMGPQQREFILDDGSLGFIRKSPNEHGCPTINDRDLLIYAVTVLVDALNKGLPTSQYLDFSARDCLLAMGKRPGGTEYESLRMTLARLSGCKFYTSSRKTDSEFSWISQYVIHKAPNGMPSRITMVLAPWFYDLVVTERAFLSFKKDYFALTKGLEKAIHQIISRHIGSKSSWHIGLEKLYSRTGSDAPFRRFMFEVRAMVERDPFSDWTLRLTTDSRLPSQGVVTEPLKGSGKPSYLYVFQRGTDIPIADIDLTSGS